MIFFDRHRRIRSKLSAYIDGKLSDDDVRSLDGHLESCDACRLELDQMRATVSAMRSLPEVETPRSFRLTPAMVTKRRPVDAWSPAPPLMNGMRMAAAGLTVALAVVFVVDLGGSSRSDNDEAGTTGMFSPLGIQENADTGNRSLTADDSEGLPEDSADAGGGTAEFQAPAGGAQPPDAAATPSPEARDDMTPSYGVATTGDEEPDADASPAPIAPKTADEMDLQNGSGLDATPDIQNSGGDFDELLAAEIGLGIALGLVLVAGAGMTFASRSRGRRV